MLTLGVCRDPNMEQLSFKKIIDQKWLIIVLEFKFIKNNAHLQRKIGETSQISLTLLISLRSLSTERDSKELSSLAHEWTSIEPPSSHKKNSFVVKSWQQLTQLFFSPFSY